MKKIPKKTEAIRSAKYCRRKGCVNVLTEVVFELALFGPTGDYLDIRICPACFYKLTNLYA